MSWEKPNRFLSIKITGILMRIVGFWTANSVSEQKILNALTVYTVFAIGAGLWIEAYDFYVSMGDFYQIVYTACSTMPVIIVMVKVGTFIYYRKLILRMLKYTQDNFWYPEYDDFGTRVLNEAETKGLLIVSAFTFFVFLTCFAYALAPIVENIGKNETDRILIFHIWLGVPLTISPYFELAFLFEILALVHTGLCFCCFDNFLGILNIHVAAQFKILGHRVTKVLSKDYEKRSDMSEEEQIQNEFYDCVVQHRTLIAYVENLEHVFTYATLIQMLISGIMVCVAGFQVFLAHGTFVRRLIFIAHTNGSFFQLFTQTLTGNDVILQSLAIGDAAYHVSWESSMSKVHGKIKTGIMMMTLRSRKPCCITAGGFFPVCLETFMTVMSTAASYFTLLRKFDTDLEG